MYVLGGQTDLQVSSLVQGSRQKILSGQNPVFHWLNPNTKLTDVIQLVLTRVRWPKGETLVSTCKQI